MNLPNAHQAIVDERKVRDYLLSQSHPVGRFKAAFFSRAGFGSESVEQFITALRDLAANGQAERGSSSEYGQKYLISGKLTGPSGETIQVTSVWILPTPDGTPRLVTVYPR